MNIHIRKSTEKDHPTILSLIKELAAFEKAPEKVVNTPEQMRQEKDFFGCFLAQTETGKIVGMALYFFAYYTWVGKSLYLDDLYVQEKYRGRGIGRRLLEKIVNRAQETHCKKVRWQVLDWNTPAIDFYKKYGARLDGEWINCDLFI